MCVIVMAFGWNDSRRTLSKQRRLLFARQQVQKDVEDQGRNLSQISHLFLLSLFCSLGHLPLLSWETGSVELNMLSLKKTWRVTEGVEAGQRVDSMNSAKIY